MSWKPNSAARAVAPRSCPRPNVSGISDEEHQLRDVAELETLEPRLAALAAGRATPANLLELEEVLRQPIAEVGPE